LRLSLEEMVQRLSFLPQVGARLRRSLFFGRHSGERMKDSLSFFGCEAQGMPQ
jgi:hypothetical protein